MIISMDQVTLLARRDLRIHVTVRHEQVHPTIVVVVEKFRSPANVRKTDCRDLRRVRYIRKRQFAVVVVKGVVIVVKIGDKQIEVAVVIVVGNGYTHGALFAAVLVHRRAGKKPDLLKRTIAIILVEEIRRRVVGDKNIYETVLIEVATDHTHTIIAIRIRHAGLFSDVGERAVAFVVVKRVAISGQTSRTTLHGHALVLTQAAFAKLRQVLEVEGDVICDHQVEF